MARQLRAMGFDARALAGGFAAWRRAYDVVPTAPSAPAMPSADQSRAAYPLWQRVRQAARALDLPFTWRRRDD